MDEACVSFVAFFQDDEETFYSIKYQIKEGDCPVQSGKSWQDCDYKEAEQAVSGMLQSCLLYTSDAADEVCRV